MAFVNLRYNIPLVGTLAVLQHLAYIIVHLPPEPLLPGQLRVLYLLFIHLPLFSWLSHSSQPLDVRSETPPPPKKTMPHVANSLELLPAADDYCAVWAGDGPMRVGVGTASSGHLNRLASGARARENYRKKVSAPKHINFKRV